MREMGFDLETPGLVPQIGKPVSMQWEYQGEEPNYSEDLSGKVIDDLRDPDVKVVMQNAAFECEWIYYHYGFMITNIEDTMILAFVMDMGAPFAYTGISKVDNYEKLKSVGLKTMAAHHLGADVWEDDLIEKLGTKKKSKGITRLVRCIFLEPDVPLKEIFSGKSKVLMENGFTDDREGREKLYNLFRSYAIKDPHLTMGMWNKLKPWAHTPAYKNLVRGIPHMIKMKYRGIYADVQGIKKIADECLMAEEDSKKEIFRLVGKEFDIASNKELPKIIKEKGIILPLTEKGNPSTNKNVLKALDTPLLKSIISYREAVKMRTTYVEGLLLEIDSESVMHPKYNTCGAVHGRYSSKGEI